MRILKWILDENSAYWASKIKLPYISNKIPVKQYDGANKHLREKTWLKHILKNKFPEYCYHSDKRRHLSCSVQNILQCVKDNNVLEALVLIVQWGTMARVKNIKVYIEPLNTIENQLKWTTTQTENTIFENYYPED